MAASPDPRREPLYTISLGYWFINSVVWIPLTLDPYGPQVAELRRREGELLRAFAAGGIVEGDEILEGTVVPPAAGG